ADPAAQPHVVLRPDARDPAPARAPLAGDAGEGRRAVPGGVCGDGDTPDRRPTGPDPRGHRLGHWDAAEFSPGRRLPPRPASLCLAHADTAAGPACGEGDPR